MTDQPEPLPTVPESAPRECGPCGFGPHREDTCVYYWCHKDSRNAIHTELLQIDYAHVFLANWPSAPRSVPEAAARLSHERAQSMFNEAHPAPPAEPVEEAQPLCTKIQGTGSTWVCNLPVWSHIHSESCPDWNRPGAGHHTFKPEPVEEAQRCWRCGEVIELIMGSWVHRDSLNGSIGEHFVGPVEVEDKGARPLSEAEARDALQLQVNRMMGAYKQGTLLSPLSVEDAWFAYDMHEWERDRWFEKYPTDGANMHEARQEELRAEVEQAIAAAAVTEALRVVEETLRDGMVREQTGGTTVAGGSDWAKPYRERGELCPSAYVCTSWVLQYFEAARRDLAAGSGSTP